MAWGRRSHSPGRRLGIRSPRASGDAMRADVVDDVRLLDGVVDAWDDLAVSARRPYCSPHWLLAWWTTAAPPGASLRVIILTSGDELVGIAPLCRLSGRAHLSRYTLLARGCSPRVEPLAREGCEGSLARAIAHELTSGRTDLPLYLSGIPTSARWPEDITASCSRAWSRTTLIRPAPTLSLEGGFEAWFASRSANFRQQMRRSRRKLERQGVVAAVYTKAEDILSRLDDFARLHHSRWRRRGGSSVLTPQVEAMLRDTADRFTKTDRLWLSTLEHDGSAVSSHLFVVAGGEASYWLGGFDETWAPQHPSLITILNAIEHASASGGRRVDLNSGGQPYKYRFSDSTEQLRWSVVLPPAPMRPVRLAAMESHRVVRAAYERLPEAARTQAKRLLRAR